MPRAKKQPTIVGTKRFQIKQKALTVRPTFSIKDESGRDAYVVTGKAVRVADQLAIATPDGRQVATIRQKILAGTPTYNIALEDGTTATLKKAAVSLRPKFKLAVDGSDAVEVTGSFTGYEYELKRSGTVVAEVSKRWFAVADTYGVEVAEGADPVLVLGAVVAIDAINALWGTGAKRGRGR